MYAHEIIAAVRAGKSVRSVTEAALARAASVQADLNAFITIMEEPALKRADELDARIKAGGDIGSLAGVPVVVKDNICTKDVLSTAASKILADFVPPYSATVVARLESAGAVVIAKANLDEFGHGQLERALGLRRGQKSLERNCGFQAALRVARPPPVAAAVCANCARYRYGWLGAATGGAFCGLLGFKPTYGRYVALRRNGLCQLARPSGRAVPQ